LSSVSSTLIRLGFLAVLPRRNIIGSIGSISPERHRRLLRRLSEYLVKTPCHGHTFTPMVHPPLKPLPRFTPGANPSKSGFTPANSGFAPGDHTSLRGGIHQSGAPPLDRFWI
jgi:hypothetical protein